MSIKDRLTKKHVLLIVLCTIAIISLIAGGSAVYAKYTKSHTVSTNGDISIEVQTEAGTALITKEYNSNIDFNDISAVFPFG